MWYSQVSRQHQLPKYLCQDGTFLCRLSCRPASARFQNFTWLRKIPMQPPISQWYNPDKICDVMVGSSTISSEHLQELQEWSLKVGEQETSGVVEEGCHWLYCSPNHFRITCDRKCFAEHRYCQKSWFENGDEQSIILLWNSAFCFGITSHPSTKHALLLSLCCFEINRCLAFYSDKIFWSNSNMR